MASSSSSFRSSFSISSTSQWMYEVFLSFRGEDTRNTLADFLSYALHRRGIYFFKDDEKLEGGKTIKPELLQAIEKSRFAVVILSENYASSTWCLEELVKIVDCKKEMGMTILPIFYNVNPSDVRKQEGTFKHPFNEYENQFKEKVRTWRDALNHVANITGYHLDNRPLSEAVKWIVGRLPHKSSFEFSEITEGLVGIHSRLVELESCLALWLKDNVRSIGFWAMGGMGKSTLANVAYKMISKEFDDCCFIDDFRNKDLFSLQKDLISQILKETDLNIQNKHDGEHIIMKMLWHKKVLLVLDDVDESNKLTKLVKSDWFGSGSRIIITTRDKKLLKEFPVDEIFEVKALNYKDALCLFCSKAFKKEQCPGEYLVLSESFLEYVNGLPIALEVLGSFLFEKSIAEWESALKMLKEDPEPKINQVLKISFDGLQESAKEIFLDIACFFNHEVKDHVVQILEILGRHPPIGLSILIEKSLLKISKNNKLWMHNLLRDTGRDIVRQESRDEPGKRSRLWRYEDIDNVLKNDTGTKKVQAMDFRGAEACWQGFTFSKKQKRPLWNPNAFSKMSNLKFLRFHNVFPQRVPKHLPNSLRYLEWSGYSAKSLPCFQPNELVQLHLQHSKIEFLWEGMKNFDELKSINMAGSSNLIKAPNFNGVPKLEELVLEGCSKLRTLDPSIGKLKNLRLLNLKKCQELTSLPNRFELKSLVTLDLTGCSKVKKIPEFVGNMKHFQELLLGGTAITDLPSSVKCLTSVSLKKICLRGTAIKELPLPFEFLIGLTSLDLTNCKNFVTLSSTICSLKSLDEIILSGCSKFDKLPKDLGNITSLKKLDLDGTAITELPSSVEFLIGLKSLSLAYCKKIVRLPSTVCSLKSLETMDLSGSPKFVNLPENIGNLKHLTRLSLDGTAIEVLPSSIGRLAALGSLNLRDCKNLVCLPSTICNLKRVTYIPLAGCSKIANLPENLGNMERLRELWLDETAIKELPSSTIHLKQVLDRFSFKDCNLSAIPSGIDCFFKTASNLELNLSGNDFISLPESFSQFSGLERLYLDGCKSLRSLSNIPSKLYFISVNNCTSLERLPEPPHGSSVGKFTVKCLNCFKLAYNIQNFSNMFQGQSSQQLQKCYIIPGREIPKWFKKVNICDTSVATILFGTYKIKKVKIQLPGSGCDEWRGIVLCVLFKPTERVTLPHIIVKGCEIRHSCLKPYGETRFHHFQSKYGKVESSHLWLHSVSKYHFRLPKTPGSHQVELEIRTLGLGVEKIGFRVV